MIPWWVAPVMLIVGIVFGVALVALMDANKDGEE